jgi:hypothetical protein
MMRKGSQARGQLMRSNTTVKKSPKGAPKKKNASTPVAAAERTPLMSQLSLSLAVALPASILELPARTQLGVRKKYGELRAAIAEGFEVQEPIYARPLWSSPDDSRIAYSFVLQREQVTRLITVPDSRTIQQFIRKHNFRIDNPGRALT